MSQQSQDPEYPDPVGAAPVGRRPPLITRSDVAAAARDALIPLGVVLVLVFGIVAGLALLLSSTGHGGFHDWFTSTVILTAGALGAASSLSFGSSIDPALIGSGSGSITGSLSFNLSFELSLTAWIITFTLLGLWAWRAKRSEAAAPSASPVQLLARSALSAVGVSLVLLILALVGKASDLFGLGNAVLGNSLGSSGSGSGSSSGSGGAVFGGGGDTSGFTGLTAGGGGMHDSIGVEPGWVFFGPLLLVLAACVAGRLAAIARRPAADPGGEWIRKLIGPWRGAGAVLWTQVRAVAILTGLTVMIYAEYRLLNSDVPGRDKAALTLVIILLAPNLALGGLLTGFGVTLFAGGGLVGVVGSGATEIGLFGDSRPWLVWLLIFEAVLGTALPWILVRTGRRAVLPAAFNPGQAWRAALIGAVAGFAVAMLGQATLTGSFGLDMFGAGGATVGLTYSVFGAILGGAIWLLAAYLAVALQVTPRAVPAEIPANAPQPAYPYAWPTTEPAPTAEPAQTAEPATTTPTAEAVPPQQSQPLTPASEATPVPAPEGTPGGDQNP